MEKQNKRKTGGRYEELAADYLRCRGYQILKMNFRCRTGEIDIVARDGAAIVFVEVKYRNSKRYGSPEEAVTPVKQRKIIRTAQFFLCRFGIGDSVPCRFDIVAVDGDGIRHIKNAFGV